MRVRRMFIGQGGGARKGGGGGMAQREQKAVLADFRKGAFNTLVATCIGEEGLDIPQVSFPTAEVPLWWTWTCLMRARINAVALLFGALQVGERTKTLIIHCTIRACCDMCHSSA